MQYTNKKLTKSFIEDTYWKSSSFRGREIHTKAAYCFYKFEDYNSKDSSDETMDEAKLQTISNKNKSK